MKRVFVIAVGVAIAELCLLALFFQPAIRAFLWSEDWWHVFLVVIPGLIVPILACLELVHSGEANTQRVEANRLRERANALQEQVIAVSAELSAERNQALQKIATGIVKPLTQGERNAVILRKHLNAKVAVVNADNSTWPSTPEIVEVGDDSTVTLFVPHGYSSGVAWCVKVHFDDLQISDIPQGACPLRLKVLKRYGPEVQLGEITRWEDRLQPSATPTFPEGAVVHHATYRKPGSADTRGLYIHASKDGANSFLLKASTGERLTGDNKDISKKFMAMQIDYLSAGFTRDGFGGRGGSNLHKLVVS
jgi:hypothetical protein